MKAILSRIEIHRNGINAHNTETSYEVWAEETRETLCTTKTLEEAVSYCISLGYSKHQIQLNF